jgi:hypothetical protein
LFAENRFVDAIVIRAGLLRKELPAETGGSVKDAF